MSPQNHQMITLLLMTCVGLLMVYAGLGKQMLEGRKRKRICPSCGHHIKGRICKRH